MADNIEALKRLSHRLNTKKYLGVYDLNVIDDAIKEITKARQEQAKNEEEIERLTLTIQRIERDE